MPQDSTKVLMGSTGSSLKKGTEVFASDPATYKAGLAVRRNSSNVLSLASGDGRWAGISLGRNLSDSKKTTVLQVGSAVPVLVERQPARGIITITSYANLLVTTPDSVTVGATIFTAQSGAVVHGGATFRAAISNNATAASLADQINNHAVAKLLVIATVVGAVVTLTAISNSTAADTIALAYTDNGSEIGATVSGTTLTDSDDTPDFVVVGQPVYFSNTTGKADDPNSDSTVSNAFYSSALLTGIDEDGNSVLACLVDMVGGL